jgi:pilus assembly protein Flp/PilA
MYRRSSNKKHEKGQGLVEYALILVLVAIVVIATLMILGPIIGNVFSEINSSLSGIGGGGGAQLVVVPTNPPASTATTAPIITGAAARAQYCADRPGYVGGVNWGGATHTFVSGGQTYQVTGSWNCPYP